MFDYFDDRRCGRARLFISTEENDLENINYEGGGEFGYVLSGWQEGASIEGHHGHAFYILRFRYFQPSPWKHIVVLAAYDRGHCFGVGYPIQLREIYPPCVMDGGFPAAPPKRAAASE